jgi:uncharacterized protein
MSKHAAKRKWLPIDYHKRINYIHSLVQFGAQVEYRSFGKLDWKASALGFGTMRLPIIGEDQAKVNEPEAIKLIRYAIDQGVNYVDSAFTYHDGNSEVTLGKALAGKYRKKAKIATKMPVFSVKRKEDLDRILNMQMTRLNTSFIDFYLFHSLNKTLWNKVKKLNMLKWAEKHVAKGRLGYLGFCFHDELEVFKEIVDSYDGWTQPNTIQLLGRKLPSGKNRFKIRSIKRISRCNNGASRRRAFSS